VESPAEARGRESRAESRTAPRPSRESCRALGPSKAARGEGENGKRSVFLKVDRIYISEYEVYYKCKRERELKANFPGIHSTESLRLRCVRLRGGDDFCTDQSSDVPLFLLQRPGMSGVWAGTSRDISWRRRRDGEGERRQTTMG
jgi:hypothetical protein